MTKEQVRDSIYKCALLYEKNLCNNQLLLVYRDADNHSSFVEARFRSQNFLHFTGVTPIKLSANDFYRRALNHKLSVNDFILDSKNAELKLQVLPTIMNIDRTARMIGDYIGPHIELYTEKVAGTTTACLGLVQKDGLYLPNSVLKEDIRSIVPYPPGKIYVIFKKRIGSHLYMELTYKSKDLRITKRCLPQELISQIDPALLELNEME